MCKIYDVILSPTQSICPFLTYSSIHELFIYLSNLNGIGIPGCYEPQLICQIGFAHPIHFVWTGDITCDGVSEIVVLSTAGIHILQVSG